MYAQPVVRAGAEIDAQPKGGVGGNGAFAAHDFADAHGAHGQFLGQAYWLRPSGFINSSSRISPEVMFCDAFMSVIIRDFNVLGIVAVPAETDAPLAVDTETVLSGPAAPKLFQPVAGRKGQLLHPLGGVLQD